MKNSLLCALTFFIVLGLSSFDKKRFNPLDITVKIADNIYLDKTEVSNLNWREYMFWTAKIYGSDSKEYKAVLPDTSVWAGDKYKPVREKYLRHPAYNEYPVVGISHEQAEAYCNWRADRINESVKIRANGKKEIPTFTCRLPSKEEWETVATEEAFEISISTSKNFGILQVSPEGVVEENEITAPVNSLKESSNGFYNLLGNVAELVAEKGTAKGGSWQHTIGEIMIGKDFKYTKPTNWIGFRCVLEKK